MMISTPVNPLPPLARLKGLGTALTLSLSCMLTSAHAVERGSASLQAIAEEARAYASTFDGGELPAYIPELTKANPEDLAVVILSVDGERASAGQDEKPFAIMSVAKVFSLALLLRQKDLEFVRSSIGIEATGFPFNSIEAILLQKNSAGNPMVNAGAQTTVNHIQPDDGMTRWETMKAWYEKFCKCELSVMDPVYQSVKKDGYSNIAMTNLLYKHGLIQDEPENVRDDYNKQSSLAINSQQLATMGLALARGGIQTDEHGRIVDRLLTRDKTRQLLALMNTAGMYDASSLWAIQVGVPAKSGVGGGILAVVPGRYSIVAFSPKLDESGNSVKAIKAIEYLADRLNLSVFSTEINPSTPSTPQ